MAGTRTVLFGGIGFIGSNLLERLPGPIYAPSLQEANLSNLVSLRKCLHAGDIIINAAGYANATDTTDKGKLLFRSVNVDGLRNLVVAACEMGAAQLVHISSVAAMGRWHEEGVTEEMMTEVETPYAASKLEGERILAQFQPKLPITILRPTSIFGEGRGLAASLCAMAAKSIIPLPGGGTAKIPFSYVGNLTKAVELTLGHEPCYGKTFIVGDTQSYPLRDIIQSLAQALGNKPMLIPISIDLARLVVNVLEQRAAASKTPPLLDRGRLDTLTNTVSYDISAFQQATGYVPPYTMGQAVERIAAWYRSQGQQGESDGRR